MKKLESLKDLNKPGDVEFIDMFAEICQDNLFKDAHLSVKYVPAEVFKSWQMTTMLTQMKAEQLRASSNATADDFQAADTMWTTFFKSVVDKAVVCITQRGHKLEASEAVDVLMRLPMDVQSKAFTAICAVQGVTETQRFLAPDLGVNDGDIVPGADDNAGANV